MSTPISGERHADIADKVRRARKYELNRLKFNKIFQVVYSVYGSVFFVNENENGGKRENNEFVNEN